MPFSDDLLELGRAAARRLDLTANARVYPAFSDTEDACGDDYEQMLELLHEDEVFAPVDVGLQEQLVTAIAAALPADKRELVEQLVDNHARHVWLQQEGAYHLGVAVGLRIAELGRSTTRGREH